MDQEGEGARREHSSCRGQVAVVTCARRGEASYGDSGLKTYNFPGTLIGGILCVVCGVGTVLGTWVDVGSIGAGFLFVALGLLLLAVWWITTDGERRV